MTLKALPFLLASFALVSCGQDWQIANGPIQRPGSTWGQDAEPEPDSSAAEAPAPIAQRPRVNTPAPISGNPFDVPDVTGDLPGERDLKPGGNTPAPVPVEPQDPDEPTIRATPGAGE